MKYKVEIIKANTSFAAEEIINDYYTNGYELIFMSVYSEKFYLIFKKFK